MSLKRITSTGNEIDSDLGPEIDIPVTLEFLRPFWKEKSSLFIHENGFRLLKRENAISVLYSEIDQVQWSESERYENGILAGTSYDTRLTIRQQQFRIRHYASSDAADSFSFLLKHIVRRVADTVQARMDLGGRLEGSNWNLSRKGLNVGSTTTGWGDIADVDLIDEQIAIWRRNQSDPIHRIRSDSSQARILLELLDRYVSEHPVADAESAPGRFLFRRQIHKGLRAFLMCLSLVLFSLSCWFFLQTPGAFFAAFSCLILSAASATYSLILMRKIFDFHQNGIIQRPGYRLFLFKNCESMRYETRMQYVNAVYGFTRITMRLRSSLPPSFVDIRVQCYGNDKELERTRTKLATQIADRMYSQVMGGSDVSWGSSGKISKHEIHFLSTRLLGGTTRYSVRLTESLAYTIDSGKFRLYRTGENVPLLTIDCEEENFYPGFFLLLRLGMERRL